MSKQASKRPPYTDEYINALIDRAASERATDPLPPALTTQIIADGKQMIGQQTERNVLANKIKRWWRQPPLAWGVALASLVLALLVNLSSLDSAATGPGDIDQRVAKQTDAVKLDWADLGDPLYANVQGHVHWSDSLQQGVMRLSGLPVNDPNQAQYQLWIVDPERDNNPVDGGVFNITEGDNLIAINAKLDIDQPQAFAITLEQPGGVVVSAGPLLVIASG